METAKHGKGCQRWHWGKARATLNWIELSWETKDHEIPEFMSLNLLGFVKSARGWDWLKCKWAEMGQLPLWNPPQNLS
jgi:hypothetical protein